jgi:hypothetical protein
MQRMQPMQPIQSLRGSTSALVVFDSHTYHHNTNGYSLPLLYDKLSIEFVTSQNPDNTNTNNSGGFGGRFAGFASFSQRAKELGNNVGFSINDTNSKGSEPAAATAAVKKEEPIMSPSKPSSIANASKEELVEVLQKMNKKVKALSALRAQLTEKVQAAEQERDTLLTLFKEQVLQGMDTTTTTTMDPEKSQIEQLQDLWKKKDQQNKQQLESLQSQMNALMQTNATNSNGNGSNGNGNPSPSPSPSGEDTAALREQLQQEHSRAMAAMKESLTKQHAAEIMAIREDAVAAAAVVVEPTTTTTTTPAGDGATSEMEDLKTNHADEMKKLKQAAALQLLTFKKKVATARAAELEKLKKETRAQVEQELLLKSSSPSASPSSSSQDAANDSTTELVQQQQQQHAQEVERVRQEAQAEASKETEAQVQKILTIMNLQGVEHEEELGRLRQASTQQLEEAQQKIQVLEQNSTGDAAARLEAASTADTIKTLQQQHKADLETLRKEMETKTAEREGNLKESFPNQRATKERALADVQGVIQQKDEELNQRRAEMAAVFESEKATLQESHTAEAERLRAELAKSAADQLQSEQATSMAEAETTKLLAETRKQMEDRVTQIRSELQTAHETELETFKSAAQSGQSNEAKAIKEKFAGQAKQFQEASVKRQADAVERAQKEIQASMTKQLEIKTNELQREMENKQKEHEDAVAQLREQSSKKIAEAKQSASSVQNDVHESSAQLKAAQEQIEAMKAVHQTNLEALRKELDSQSEARLAASSAVVLKEAEEKALATLEQLKTQKEEEMQAFRTTVTIVNEHERKKVQDAHSSELESVQEKLRQEAIQQVDQAKASSSFAKDSELSQARQEAEEKVSQVRLEIEQSKSKELEAVRAEAAAALKQATEDSQSKAAQAMESSRNEYEQNIKDIQATSKKTLEELQAASEKEQGLQGQVQELTSKLAVLHDEKEAILSAAKDGEESSKGIEESLAKQRASYEEMLNDQRARFEEEVKGLQSAVAELSSVREKVAELSELNSKREKQVSDLSEKLREAERKLEHQASLSTDEDAKNSTQRAANEELERQLKAIQADFDNKQSEAANNLASFEAERNNFSQKNFSLQTELEEITNRLSARDAELQNHASTSVESGEKLSTLLSKYQELENNYSSLQDKSNARETEVESTMNTLQGEKEQSSKQLSVVKKELDDLLKQSSEMNGAEKRLREENTCLREEVEKLKSTLDETSNSANKGKVEADNELSGLQQKLIEAEKTISSMKAEHEASLKGLRESVQSDSTTTSERVEELESLVAEKSKLLADATANFDEQLSELMKKQSTLQLENGEFDNRLKQIGDSHAAELKEKEEELLSTVDHLQQEHAETVAKLREEHNMSRGKLEAEAGAHADDVEAKIKQELELESQKHAKEVEQMKIRMADHVDKMKAQFMSKLSTEREKQKVEIEEAEKKDKNREEQVAKLASQLKAVGEAVKKEREEKFAVQKALKAEHAARQKVAKELESQNNLLEETMTTSESTASSLVKEQDELKKRNAALESDLKKLKADRDLKANKVEEVSFKLEALTNNLNSMAEDINKKDEALLQADKQKIKLESSESEVSDLRQQINKLKLELTKNSQLANRLQREKDNSETNHGQRTALMGMLESQLAEVNEQNAESNAKLEAALYDLSQKDDILNNIEEKLKQTQTTLTEAQKEKKEVGENLLLSHKGAAKKSAMMVESLQRELQQLQQSTARKSAAAQKLIQTSEAECAELKATTKKLQQEVDNGSLSDRKIFELAELQSIRESARMTEIEVRDSALDSLRKALLDRDGDLALAETIVQEVEGQVEELCRVRRREDVNMDYLKSIVVQFLSKPPGTSERSALLPVLATLLQVRKIYSFESVHFFWSRMLTFCFLSIV